MKLIHALPLRSRWLPALACLVLSACGGGSAPSGGGGLGPLAQIHLGSLTIRPNLVLLKQGESATVRIDTNLLPPTDGVVGYSIGLSVVDAHFNIVTAPCLPVGSGSASCRDWTITPLPGAIPGEHHIDIASVGARSGKLTGNLHVRVVGSPVQSSALAVDYGRLAGSEPFSTFDGPTLVLLSNGRIAAAGANGSGEVGVGYRPFILDSPGSRFSPRPWHVDEFVNTASGPLFEHSGSNRGRWLAVAAGPGISYALRDDNTVWAWGDTGSSLGDDPFSPRQFTQLPPIVEISAGKTGGALAIANDGRVWALERLAYQEHLSQPPPEPITILNAQGTRTPLTNVSSIAGSVASTAMFIQGNGSVWLQHDGQEHAQQFPGLSSPAIGIATSPTDGRYFRTGYYVILLADGTLIEGRHNAGADTSQTIAAPGSNFAKVSAGAEFAYALRRDGTVWSWRPFTTAPTQVAGLADVVSLGPDHAIRGNCPGGSGELWRILHGTDAARLPGFRGTVGCGIFAGGRFKLTVEITGPGSAEVLPAGQLCRGRCEVEMDAGIAVRLQVAWGNHGNGAHSDPRCHIDARNTLAAFSLDRDITCRYSFPAASPSAGQIPLTINLDGPGTVTSTPPGIDCGTTCTTNLTAAYTFLTRAAAPGFRFDGFVGDWDCERGVINLSARKSDFYESQATGKPPLMSPICTARFVPVAAPPSARLDIAVVGNGDVVGDSGAINCGSVCSAAYAPGTTVRLEPRPRSGYRFFEWSGNADCRDGSVTLNSNQACTATFAEVTAPATATLTVAISGPGKVAVNPPGVECGPTCSASYLISVPATLVSLAPRPDPGRVFAGWSGDCSGNAAISIVMDASKVCTATFVVPPPSGWQPVGAAVSQSGVSGMAIAVDSSQATGPVVYAAVAQNGPGNHIDLVVYRFEGNTWTPVGGNLIESGVVSGIAFAPSIAIDSGGAITVAWAENRRRIRVKQWNGTQWVTLGGVLNIDTNPLVEVFDTQLAVSGSGSLVVAWLETVGNNFFGRMALKRFNPAAQFWSGDYVLPTVANVLSLRLTTEPLGHALLMFVPSDAARTSLEGSPRVVRQDNLGAWSDVCTPLTRPSAANVFYPNTEIGFGIAPRGITRGPVAIFNNGEAIFAVKCGGGAWTGLDGSELGQVAVVGQGESLYALSVNYASLAWSKVRQLVGGDREIPTQVMVENPTETALVPSGTPLTFFNASFNQGGLSHTFLPSGSALLAGPILDNGAYSPRVYRFEP